MIKGLTDRGASFPKIGTLRKGAPKEGNRPGSDLHHFRFDSDDTAATAAFTEAYGAEPNYISVYLPYATTEENFQAWKEEWAASSLKHRCDGETCTRWLMSDGKTYSGAPKPCPGNCKPAGRLMVIIPELRRFAYVTVLTTSIHDIMELQANLEATEALRGDLRGIPFILARKPRQISTPREGKRVRVEKWLLSIEPGQNWVGYQLQAMERAALPAGSVKLLSDGRSLDTVTGEVIDEAPDVDEEEPQEQPEQAVIEQEPAASPPARLNRAVLTKAIQQLWAEERTLTDDLATQNIETDIDLSRLPVGSKHDEPAMATLCALGKRIRARVDALKVTDAEPVPA